MATNREILANVFSETADETLMRVIGDIAASNHQGRKDNAASMVWELYRDKVLTSFQTKEILVCLGFTVTYDSKNEQLVSFR